MSAQCARDEENASHVVTRRTRFIRMGEQHTATVGDENPLRLELRGRFERLIQDIVATPLRDQRAKVRTLHEHARPPGETAFTAGEKLGDEIG